MVYLESLKKIHSKSNVLLEDLLTIIKRYVASDEKIVSIDYFAEGRVNVLFVIKLKKLILILRERKKVNSFVNNLNWIDLINFMDVNHYNIFPKIYYNDIKRGISIIEFLGTTTLENELTEKNLFYTGKNLRKLHDIIVPKDSTIWISSLLSKQDVDDYYLSYYAKVIGECKVFFPKEAKLVGEIIAKRYRRGIYKHYKLSILHHDFHLKNIMIHNNKITFIDWDSSRIGVAEEEFVKLKHLNWKYFNNAQKSAFIKGYNEDSRIVFTENFKCHEAIWLLKMLVFEYTNQELDNDSRYFPPIKYYRKEIRKIASEKEN
ncbi:hypothetical protein Aargi30884_17350 [Amedibacterium intestinale]|uniref:Aminoglycoside phosphotransferase domain-containing protein n=1 Tax=Amedibacterium intestinale TaxID=2583452 RepID=A0A6N4TL78_9FIRM|nr:phosphotransferase [Amedibacterium intestinale]BBK22832.1 hypothetical protein Aargi30884_17350 [Amedibacterium intestinale]